MQHTFIPLSEAAAMLGYTPVTMSRKIRAVGRYEGKQPLPIKFNTGGKGLRVSKEDVEKYLRQTTS